jgi:hypothetical protein
MYEPVVGSRLQQWSGPSCDVLQQGLSKRNTISNKEGIASMAGRWREESVGDEG